MSNSKASEMTIKLSCLLEIAENIVEKGENAGNQHFLLFFTTFSKRSHVQDVETMAFLMKG